MANLLTPKAMWTDVVAGALPNGTFTPADIEQGPRKLSDEIPLRVREVLGLMLLAYARGGAQRPWNIGYDDTVSEPNDGTVTDGDTAVTVEQKLVTYRDTKGPTGVLDAIHGTYTKYAAGGPAYGAGRDLLILTNKGDGHLIKTSTVRDLIANDPVNCPFDRVVLAGLVSQSEDWAVLTYSLTVAYPGASGTLAHVALDVRDGTATVPHNGVKW